MTDAIGVVSAVCIVITQPTPLALSEMHADNLCNGYCNGTVVLTGSGGTPAYQNEIDLSKLPNAVYFLQMKTGKGVITKKIIRNF